MPKEEDHIRGVQAPGRYDATVGSEVEARRIIEGAMPDAVEVTPAVVGHRYPVPAPGVKKWFQAQPSEPQVGNDLPHIRYQDWTRGKKDPEVVGDISSSRHRAFHRARPSRRSLRNVIHV